MGGDKENSYSSPGKERWRPELSCSSENKVKKDRLKIFERKNGQKSIIECESKRGGEK